MVRALDRRQDTLPDAEVRRVTDAVLAAEDQPDRDVSIRFIDDEAMAQLNRQRRGKPGPTDVLSFPFDDSFPHGRGGEVLICPAVARRTAAEEHRQLDAVLTELLVHGLLHLTGHEDETAAGRARMQRRTGALLTELS